MKRGKRDHNRRNNFWHISLTAAVAALLVHNAINGGPAKARGHVSGGRSIDPPLWDKGACCESRLDALLDLEHTREGVTPERVAAVVLNHSALIESVHKALTFAERLKAFLADMGARGKTTAGRDAIGRTEGSA